MSVPASPSRITSGFQSEGPPFRVPHRSPAPEALAIGQARADSRSSPCPAVAELAWSSGKETFLTVATTVESESYAAAVGQVPDPRRKQKQLGQYFTPPEIAEFMAGLFELKHKKVIRLLDPGAGAGVLGLAAATALTRAHASSVDLSAYELDSEIIPVLSATLTRARQDMGGLLAFRVFEGDFIAETASSLFSRQPLFDAVIANPPYFKTSPGDTADGADPNIYARFMRRSAELLAPDGMMVFIVPRSFMSGFYYRKFRAFLRSRLTLERIHVFDSRRAAFQDQGVLQENVIVVYRNGPGHRDYVEVSSSSGLHDLGSASTLTVPNRLVFSNDRLDAALRVPTNRADLELIEHIEGYPERLSTLGLEISTGPVVPFRATEFLDDGEKVSSSVVPLLWLQHVTPAGVVWPISGFRKPQRIQVSAPAKLRAPNQTCVLIRRFSAKEDKQRLVACAYKAGEIAGDWLGLENHLNFIYRPNGQLDITEAQGLARLLNSRSYDDYFRVCNGNTQVGATEIRELPLPPMASIRQLSADADSVSARTAPRHDHALS